MAFQTLVKINPQKAVKVYFQLCLNCNPQSSGDPC